MLDLQPSTSIQRKLLFEETFLNLTDKISKISDNSVFAGTSGGVSKLTGKAEKDIVLALSQLFPDDAYGTNLDQVAENFGVPPRLGAQGSSTYVRVVGNVGTSYSASINQLQSNSGVLFQFEQDFTIPSFGFTYQKVNSISTGEITNVDPLTISTITPTPSGHIGVVNEYKATGGIDEESDQLFRVRIKQGSNILARGTLAMLEQVFIKINPKVLRVDHHGIDNNGNIVLSILTQNGANLTDNELNQLLTQGGEYFSLTESKPFGFNFYGVVLQNMTFQPIDCSYRVQFDQTVDPDIARIDMQVALSKYLDFRTFDPSKQAVQWTDLLSIIKNTKGVVYVPDQYAFPHTDIPINIYQLPRIRGFLLLDLQGSVISNFSGTLSPTFYPNSADFTYQTNILRSL